MQTEPEKVVLVKKVVEKEPIHPYRWRAVTASFAIIGIGFALTTIDLRHNDSEIQKSRVTSCIHNYGAFNEVFAPFFPPPGKRTKMQQHNLNILHATVKRLQAGCAKQIRIK